jgi:hypothetical protein
MKTEIWRQAVLGLSAVGTRFFFVKTYLDIVRIGDRGILIWLSTEAESFFFSTVSRRPVGPTLPFVQWIAGILQIYSGNLICELPNTAHICSRHGPAAAWLTSAWPGNVIPVPETYSVGSRSTLSIFIATLDYPADNVSLSLSLLWMTLLDICDTPRRPIA